MYCLFKNCNTTRDVGQLRESSFILPSHAYSGAYKWMEWKWNCLHYLNYSLFFCWARVLKFIHLWCNLSVCASISGVSNLNLTAVVPKVWVVPHYWELKFLLKGTLLQKNRIALCVWTCFLCAMCGFLKHWEVLWMGLWACQTLLYPKRNSR